MNPLKIEFRKDPEGGYNVSCPQIQGCHTQGDTLKEALSNIGEVISLHAQDRTDEEVESIFK